MNNEGKRITCLFIFHFPFSIFHYSLFIVNYFDRERHKKHEKSGIFIDGRPSNSYAEITAENLLRGELYDIFAG
jgi:hypothetical protein